MYESLPNLVGIIQIVGALIWVGVGCVMNAAVRQDWKIRAVVYLIVISGFWSGLAHILGDQYLYIGNAVFALSVMIGLPVWVIYFHEIKLKRTPK